MAADERQTNVTFCHESVKEHNDEADFISVTMGGIGVRPKASELPEALGRLRCLCVDLSSALNPNCVAGCGFWARLHLIAEKFPFRSLWFVCFLPCRRSSRKLPGGNPCTTPAPGVPSACGHSLPMRGGIRLS